MNRPNRTIAGVLLAGAMVLTACGDDSDDPAPATQPEVTEDSMVDEEMTDDSMVDDSMVDEEMTDDSMVDEEMTDTTAAP
jgi:hypothetical protein